MLNVVCVRWGDKYNEYTEKLKEQVEKKCSVPFNFYCLTDTPQKEYEIQLPTHWDSHYIKDRFWAYRKLYIFNEDLFPTIKGNEFLYLDQDVLIHQNLKYFFDLEMSRPYIVRGWWNDIDTCKKNFGKIISTPLNSSVIRWTRGQLKPVYNYVEDHKDIVFFSYKTIDNFYNHKFYDVHNEDEGFFKPFPKNDIYSWYKGNIFPDDMGEKILRPDCKICLFNNSYVWKNKAEHMNQIDEIKRLW